MFLTSVLQSIANLSCVTIYCDITGGGSIKIIVLWRLMDLCHCLFY